MQQGLLHEDDEKVLTYISEKCYEINKEYVINYKSIEVYTSIGLDEIKEILHVLEINRYIKDIYFVDDGFNVSLTLSGRRYVRDNELKS